MAQSRQEDCNVSCSADELEILPPQTSALDPRVTHPAPDLDDLPYPQALRVELRRAHNIASGMQWKAAEVTTSRYDLNATLMSYRAGD